MEEMEAEIRMFKLRIERNERIKCHFVVARLKRELAQLENELKELCRDNVCRGQKQSESQERVFDNIERMGDRR